MTTVTIRTEVTIHHGDDTVIRQANERSAGVPAGGFLTLTLRETLEDVTNDVLRGRGLTP